MKPHAIDFVDEMVGLWIKCQSRHAYIEEHIMNKAILGLVVFFFHISECAADVRKIPIMGLSDIAISSIDNLGPVIYYNPYLVSSVPPTIAKFFFLHEEGHHALSHIERKMFFSNPYNHLWVSQSLEKEADCFASQRLSQMEKQFVASWFAKMQGGAILDWYHPTGYERALVIMGC